MSHQSVSMVASAHLMSQRHMDSLATVNRIHINLLQVSNWFPTTCVGTCKTSSPKWTKLCRV